MTHINRNVFEPVSPKIKHTQKYTHNHIQQFHNETGFFLSHFSALSPKKRYTHKK